MSHVNAGYTYPQTTDRDPALIHPWQIREDGDDTDKGGNSNRDTLLALTDRITERLTRAEALAWMLQSAEQPPEHAPKVTAMLILELIQEAREANEKVWEVIRQEADSEK